MSGTSGSSSGRASWSGQLAFVLAAAASAVGLGNLWRFPYLAAKYGGGVFIAVYLALSLTLGITLLVTEIALGRYSRQSQLTEIVERICGTGTGVIRKCENHGAVGYPKLGFNVGGIAGSYIGFITDCVNYAVIAGRKDVGGYCRRPHNV